MEWFHCPKNPLCLCTCSPAPNPWPPFTSLLSSEFCLFQDVMWLGSECVTFCRQTSVAQSSAFKFLPCLSIVWQLILFKCWITFQWASLVAQMVKNLPVMLETRVWSLAQENPLEQEMATHSSMLAWRIHGQGSLEGYSPWGHKRVRHDWVTFILRNFPLSRYTSLFIHWRTSLLHPDFGN